MMITHHNRDLIKTAIRYAENAHVLLASMAEEQDPASRDEPKGQNQPWSLKTLGFRLRNPQFT